MESSGDPAGEGTIVDGFVAGGPPDGPVTRQIGRYLVIDEIGAGGMGRVYRAYDPKLSREVALKHLHLRDGHDANDGARMIREAKAMAQLAHPNVVSIFDVDIDRGSVFIAMEYVKGVTLAKWLGDAERGVDAILDMFVQAGRGLAAAHVQGIVHRDFKPSNVVIGEDGRPRVMDFGLARTSSDPSIERSGGAERASGADSDDHGAADLGEALTADGTVVGTPPFMAPEQHVGEPVDARTDQYAFCVALWAALYRRPPFFGRDLASLARAKLAGPPKAPPGSGVSTKLYALLARGLAATPARRWPDMPTLLDAIGRARSPVGWRWPLGGALIGGVAVAAWVAREPPCAGSDAELADTWNAERRAQIEQAMRETKASFAESTLARVGATLDAHAAAWIAMHRDTCEASRVRKEQSDEALDLRMACLHAREQEFGDAIALLADVDASVAARAIGLVHSLTPIERCADVAALRERVPPPEQAEVREAVTAVRATLEQARLQFRAGRAPGAIDVAEAARTEAIATGYAPVIAEAEVLVANLMVALDRGDEARGLLEHALDSALAHRHHHTAAAAATGLAMLVRRDSGDARQSHWLARTAIGLAEGDGTDPLLISRAMLAYGHVFADRELELEAQPWFASAVSRLEQAFGPGHPSLVSPLLAHAEILRALDRIDEADGVVRRALTIIEAAYGLDHPQAAEALLDLGWNALSSGRPAEALDDFDRALAIVEAAFGPEHDDVWAALGMRATALAELGRYDEAIAAIEESLRRMGDRLIEEHPARVSSLHNLAGVFATKGDHARAVATSREVVRLRRKVGHKGPLAAALMSLGRGLTRLGQFDDAERALVEAAEIVAAAHVDDGIYEPEAEASLAEAIMARGDGPRARALLERVVEKSAASTDASSRANSEFLLGQVLWDLNEDRPRAVAMVESALARLADRPGDAAQIEAMRTWLDRHTIDSPETLLVAAPP